jgi:hypothetical protein
MRTPRPAPHRAISSITANALLSKAFTPLASITSGAAAPLGAATFAVRSRAAAVASASVTRSGRTRSVTSAPGYLPDAFLLRSTSFAISPSMPPAVTSCWKLDLYCSTSHTPRTFMS